MSINDNLNSLNSALNRINNAKAAIASAITAKGVAVPAGTSIDGYSALIRNIKQGVEASPDKIIYSISVVDTDCEYIYQGGFKNFISALPLKMTTSFFATYNFPWTQQFILNYSTERGYFIDFYILYDRISEDMVDRIIFTSSESNTNFPEKYENTDEIWQTFMGKSIIFSESSNTGGITGLPSEFSATLNIHAYIAADVLYNTNDDIIPTLPTINSNSNSITVSGFGMALQRYNTTYQLSADGKYWKADVTSSSVLELRIKYGTHPGNSQKCWIFGDDTGTMQAFIYSTNSDPQSILGTQSCVDASNTNYTLTITSGGSSVETTGLLEVITSPTLTPPTGAQWSIDGVTWNSFGLRISVSAGTYTVQFKDVSGYTTPASQTAIVTAGQVTSITVGEYVASGGESGGGSASGQSLRLTSSSVANGCAQVYNLTSGDLSNTPTAGSNSLVFTGVSDSTWTIVIEYEAEFSSIGFFVKQNGNTKYSTAVRNYPWQNLADTVAQIQTGLWLDNNTEAYITITLTVEESGSSGGDAGGN